MTHVRFPIEFVLLYICNFVYGQFHPAVYSPDHHIELPINTEQNGEFIFKVKYRNKPIIKSLRQGSTLNKTALKRWWLQ